jgi:IclR family acetate operon transcriptional repressor
MATVPSGSGERLLHIIKLMATGPETFTLGQIAERAGLPLSSVHRVLKTLERSGFVERGNGQSYCLGRELKRIASLIVSSFDIGRCSRPLLEGLVQDFHETAVLCVYSPPTHRGKIAEVVMTPHPLRFSIEKGVEISLPWGSLGHAILAHLPPSEIELILRKENAGPLTGRPRATKQALESELGGVRKAGYVLFCDEHSDLAGIAAPVFRGNEVLGSIGFILPSSRYGLIPPDTLGLAVRDAARELSRQAELGS